jgi:hypothetical protein
MTTGHLGLTLQAPPRTTLIGTAALVGLALMACKKDEQTPAASASPPSSAPTAAVPATTNAKPSLGQLAAETKPVVAQPSAQPLGKYTVKAEVCAIEGGGPLGASRSSVMPSIAIQGSRAYAASGDEKLHAYEISTGGGCTLKPVASFGTDGAMATDPKVRTVSASKDLLVASSGVFGSGVIKGDKLHYKCDARPQGHVALHPSGKWGIGSFANATVAKVSFNDTTCTSEPWVFQDLSRPDRKGELTNVNSVGFLGDTVLVGGIVAKQVNPKEPRVVLGMNQAGKQLFRLGNLDSSSADDGLGWVHAVSGCGVGICVLDGNYKKLALWTRDGAFIGKIALDKLFGVRAPWINSFAVAPDKSLYFVAGVDREGGKVAEGLVFRVTGL